MRDEVRGEWARRGLELEGELEEAGVYAPVLLLRDLDPAEAARRWSARLHAAGFVPFDLDACGDELGVLPNILGRPDVHGGAARRDGETVVFYAMRGGLPVAGIIPTRARAVLHTRALLGRWGARGLEGAGETILAQDEGLVLRAAGAPGAAFEVLVSAFLATGATPHVSEAEHVRRSRDGLIERLCERGVSRRRAQRMAESASTARQVTLLDGDGAALVVETRDPAVAVEVSVQLGADSAPGR